ncbi:hypothetical protein [Acetobacter orientalis]
MDAVNQRFGRGALGPLSAEVDRS